jgi:hypothetical protein
MTFPPLYSPLLGERGRHDLELSHFCHRRSLTQLLLPSLLLLYLLSASSYYLSYPHSSSDVP